MGSKFYFCVGRKQSLGTLCDVECFLKNVPEFKNCCKTHTHKRSHEDLKFSLKTRLRVYLSKCKKGKKLAYETI
jgi:hypothetical protein